MTDTAKGLVLGLILGAGVTLAAGAAVMILVVTPKTNAAIASVKKADDQACGDRISASLDAIATVNNASAQRMLATQQVVDSSQADGFTALLEPAPPKSSATLELFNIVRPGLGALLVKLQAAQSQQSSVVWVVEGRVKPASSVPGSSYCWLNASGEVEACQAVSQ